MFHRTVSVGSLATLALLGLFWSSGRSAAQSPAPSFADPFTVPFTSSIDDPSVYGRYIQGPGFRYLGATAPTFFNAPILPPDAPEEKVAYIHIRVSPPHAQISIQGAKTAQIGSSRLFVSPPLNQGENYQYDIRATWTENGKQITQDRTIPVRAGDRMSIVFREPASGSGTTTLRTTPASTR
jgi:uncharacterized protein (TIGR03000 family)